MSRNSLPEFSNPPLVETAIGVQFEPIPQLPLFFGNFISQQADVVEVETKAPLDPVIERIGGKAPERQGGIELMSHPPTPRYWLFNEDKSELLQLQHDRLIWNWRKTSSNDEYPRFDIVFAKFASRFQDFIQYARQHSIPNFQINQCEITYVNQIGPECEQVLEHRKASKVFRSLADFDDGRLPKLEFTKFACSHLLENEDGEFIGRLHIVAEPIFLKGEESFSLKLVARGRPKSSEFEDLKSFFDIGHEAIVTSFAAYTTREMHKEWGLNE